MAATQKFSNSGLICYTKLSPNHSGLRTHNIEQIAIHTMAGNCSVETCGEIFSPKSRQASSNYGIGSDGRIAMYVEEKNRSWCTSSSAVDQRAITIEVASSVNRSPWPCTDAAYESLIDLCVDICQRNPHIKKIMWVGDKSLLNKTDKQNLVPHRWTANKSCPGDWLYERFDDIRDEVNKRLSSNGSNVSSNTATIITKESNESYIWNFLTEKGLNAYAVAGIMGNLYAESALIPNNLQNTYEKKLGLSDSEYTSRVDSGKYTNFVKDSAGYGLAQWTYWSRKQALLNYAKKTKKSIGDLQMQCEFLWTEMQGYKKMMTVLKSAKSVREASNIFLTEFERPANMGIEVQNKRTSYGEKYYKNNANTSTSKPASSTTSGAKVPYLVKVTASSLNIRKGPGTNYGINRAITDRGTYTIVAESSGKGASKWGKLKSGAGWISLDYCQKR